MDTRYRYILGPIIGRLSFSPWHMHKRNPYRTPLNFASLSEQYPNLKSFLLRTSSAEGWSIDFKNVEAQRCLTEALLWCDFRLKFSLPEGRLCPPVPNRLNYILWLQDILSESFSRLEDPPEIVGIDIGTGASAIYPLLGCKIDPSWKFIGTEIDPVSYASAVINVDQNNLQGQIKISSVTSENHILTPFHDEPKANFTFTMCNPPFYSDVEEIERSAEGKALEPNSVCTGAEVEMITLGGEETFVERMITESTHRDVKDRCLWFTSMLGKLSSLEKIVETLRIHKIYNYALTELVQGRTRRWVVAWSFSDLRLPDNLGRNLPYAHHALFPRHNNFEKVLPWSSSIDAVSLRDDILGVLSGLQGVTFTNLPQQSDDRPSQSCKDGDAKDTLSFRISAIQNSWSRKARRAISSTPISDRPVIMIADVSAVRKEMKGEELWVLIGRWRLGRDRELFESFWSHVSRKIEARAVGSKSSE